MVKLGIGRKFQTPSIFGSLTVYQNLEVALGFSSRVTSLLGGFRRQGSDRIMATLEEVGLAARASDTAGALFPRREAVAGKRYASGPGTQAVVDG